MRHVSRSALQDYWRITGRPMQNSRRLYRDCEKSHSASKSFGATKPRSAPQRSVNCERHCHGIVVIWDTACRHRIERISTNTQMSSNVRLRDTVDTRSPHSRQQTQRQCVSEVTKVNKTLLPCVSIYIVPCIMHIQPHRLVHCFTMPVNRYCSIIYWVLIAKQMETDCLKIFSVVGNALHLGKERHITHAFLDRRNRHAAIREM